MNSDLWKAQIRIQIFYQGSDLKLKEMWRFFSGVCNFFPVGLLSRFRPDPRPVFFLQDRIQCVGSGRVFFSGGSDPRTRWWDKELVLAGWVISSLHGPHLLFDIFNFTPKRSQPARFSRFVLFRFLFSHLHFSFSLSLYSLFVSFYISLSLFMPEAQWQGFISSVV